jgi:hypothetical protein
MRYTCRTDLWMRDQIGGNILQLELGVSDFDVGDASCELGEGILFVTDSFLC